eukprot:gnl/TRDRNA2_/TRDRNA2_120326_c0_seq1.p2 gnl/TRDRNA2_/TRDRNA2_120326_c0~~gnl/TRDRNA2_/TRDRNA2_120326_c0_seq1.p2  ORF type:complete len:111 (-),score=7.30 gnl/TRDRNA2_/TRDRNA2_120326_c0_seq1:126-458(-)
MFASLVPGHTSSCSGPEGAVCDIARAETTAVAADGMHYSLVSSKVMRMLGEIIAGRDVAREVVSAFLTAMLCESVRLHGTLQRAYVGAVGVAARKIATAVIGVPDALVGL